MFQKGSAETIKKILHFREVSMSQIFKIVILNRTGFVGDFFI